MPRLENKLTRIGQIEALLWAYKDGLKPAEIARKLGIKHRSTVTRCAPDLPAYIHEDDEGRWKIDREADLVKIALTLHEAMAVHLAARLLARYSDKPNPHAVVALSKLSMGMQRAAPMIAQHIAQTSAKINRPIAEATKTYLDALETLTHACADGTRVQLVMREKPDMERLFDPYFIELIAVGYLTYAIGFDHYRQEVLTFTIDRLLSVTATHEPYTIPTSFNPLTKLAGAWGVNWGDGKPVEVVLRFTAGRVANRVSETNWHETQIIEPLVDGGCILRIKVGSTQEMKPWIRQWGPDCVVLEPPELRKEIGEEMRRAGELYSIKEEKGG